MVTAINGSTFIKDTTIFLKNLLKQNVTDPLGRGGAGSTFVYTSYPQANIKYPIVTVRNTGFDQPQRGGMRSSQTITHITTEIRVWATNEVHKDEITQDIYYQLKNKQFGTGSTTENVELHDFQPTSVVDVDEANQKGEVVVKSKVMEYRYLYINKD